MFRFGMPRLSADSRPCLEPAINGFEPFQRVEQLQSSLA
jgi:hypothetical protein